MERIRGTFEKPRGSGVYGIDFRDGNGRRVRELVGSLAAAMRQLQDRKEQVARGEYVPRCSWTFARLAQSALAEKSNRTRPSTIESNRLRLGKLLPIIGHARVMRLTPARIEDLMAGLKRSGLSNSTVNLYRFFLSSVFAYGVKLKLIPANPIAQVKKYPENPWRVRYLLADEEVRLRKEFIQDSHEAEFHLALNTGMRRGEQFFLRWADVNLEIGKLRVDGKTGPGTIPINSEARKALDELWKISGTKEFVCPDNDGRAQRDWRRWFEIAIKRAGIKNFHYHDLRHSFASRLVMAGVNLRVVQELMRHKSIKMTERYAHLSPDQLNAAVEKLVKKK